MECHGAVLGSVSVIIVIVLQCLLLCYLCSVIIRHLSVMLGILYLFLSFFFLLLFFLMLTRLCYFF